MRDQVPRLCQRHLRLWAALSALLILTGAAGPSTQPTQPAGADAFVFDGKPIHPACLWLLRTELSDLLPVCAAIDVEGCGRSNAYSLPVISLKDGGLRIESKELFGTGYFEYRWIGQLNNGVHIVETFDYGGGSGVFEDLLFVRLATDRVWESGQFRNRTQLLLCGSYGLGDRDSGSGIL